MKKTFFAAAFALISLLGCSSAGTEGGDAATPDDSGHAALDVGEPDSSHPSDASSDDSAVPDAGPEDSGAEPPGPDTGIDAGADAGASDAGTDGGTADPCAGVYPPECLRGLLADNDRCAPEKAAAIDRIVRQLVADMEVPMQYLDDAYFLYAGTASSASVAGEFNAWTPAPLEKICDLDVWALKVTTTGGRYEYKLIVDGAWILDPGNRAFAYDDFSGNADHKNSVLNFWASGKSHLEWWRDVASPQLGNVRDLYVYVPPGYNPMGAQAYPVLYMHDGQNIFDDKTCCFGNGGWEVNAAADAEIARDTIPFFVVGVANTDGRNDEYTPCVEDNGGTPFGGKADLYAQFLIETVFPLMEQHYRIYPDGRAIAGSSLGGTISMYIGLSHPDLFPKGIGSMSGAFWVCQTAGAAARDQVKALTGHLALPVYLDSGGDLTSGDDGAKDTAEVRDLLVGKGWLLWTADGADPCAGAYDLCYHLEQGAPHNETAWRTRVWRMLGYLQ